MIEVYVWFWSGRNWYNRAGNKLDVLDNGWPRESGWYWVGVISSEVLDTVPYPSPTPTFS